MSVQAGLIDLGAKLLLVWYHYTSPGGGHDVSDSRACVGCGYCCKERICRIGAMIYGHYTNPCPALTWSDNRYLCALYLDDPARYELVIDIGGGCCFPSNSQREQMKK